MKVLAAIKANEGKLDGFGGLGGRGNGQSRGEWPSGLILTHLIGWGKSICLDSDQNSAECHPRPAK